MVRVRNAPQVPSLSNYYEERPTARGSQLDLLLDQLRASEPLETTTASGSRDMIKLHQRVLDLVREYAQRMWGLTDNAIREAAKEAPTKRFTLPDVLPPGARVVELGLSGFGYIIENKNEGKGAHGKGRKNIRSDNDADAQVAADTKRSKGKVQTEPQRKKRKTEPGQEGQHQTVPKPSEFRLYHIPAGEPSPATIAKFPELCAQAHESNLRQSTRPGLGPYRTAPMLAAEGVYNRFRAQVGGLPTCMVIPIGTQIKIVRAKNKEPVFKVHVDHVHENIRIYGSPPSDGGPTPSMRLRVTEPRCSESNKGLFPPDVIEVFEALNIASGEMPVNTGAPNVVAVVPVWDCDNDTGRMKGLPPPMYSPELRKVPHGSQFSYCLTKWIANPQRTDSPFGALSFVPETPIPDRILWVFLPFASLVKGLASPAGPKLMVALTEKGVKKEFRSNPGIRTQPRIWSYPGVRVVFYKTATTAQSIKDLISAEYETLLSRPGIAFEERGDQQIMTSLLDAAVRAKENVEEAIGAGGVETTAIQFWDSGVQQGVSHPDKALTVRVYVDKAKEADVESYHIPEHRVFLVDFDL
jgi:hypothetical protein